MREHFFVDSATGSLYDTRAKKTWQNKPLRALFKLHCGNINTVAEFKATLRAGAYAWPGGYPLYFVCADGGALHFKCARDDKRAIIGAMREEKCGSWNSAWRCVACAVNYEDNNLMCDQCGEMIEAADL